MGSPDIRGFGRPSYTDRDTREMMAARTADASVIRPSVSGLKTLKFQDALRSPACQPPVDWTSIPQDERPDSPAEHEIAYALDDGGSVSEAEIPVHHQRALGLTPGFRGRRAHGGEIVATPRVKHGSINDDGSDALHPSKAPEVSVRRVGRDGTQIFVKPHKPRPELSPSIDDETLREEEAVDETEGREEGAPLVFEAGKAGSTIADAFPVEPESLEVLREIEEAGERGNADERRQGFFDYGATARDLRE